MRGPFSGTTMICMAVILLACQPATGPVDTQFRTQIIAPVQLPRQFDSTRTYVYKYSQADAESLLAEMKKVGLPLSRAWLPLDNLCMGPIGPRFTVELKRPDARILKFGFEKGLGRLSCAGQIAQYIFR